MVHKDDLNVISKQNLRVVRENPSHDALSFFIHAKNMQYALNITWDLLQFDMRCGRRYNCCVQRQ